MRASKWVIQKLIELLRSEDGSAGFSEMKKIFARYPDDMTLSKIGKDFNDYAEKPTKKKLSDIKRKLENMLKTRKFETSGGTTLWFGDRRKTRSSQMTR